MVEALKKYEQILSKDQINKLQIFSDRVLQWNKYTNLTGAKDSTIFLKEHVVDCLSVVPFFETKKSIVDVAEGESIDFYGNI